VGSQGVFLGDVSLPLVLESGEEGHPVTWDDKCSLSRAMTTSSGGGRRMKLPSRSMSSAWPLVRGSRSAGVALSREDRHRAPAGWLPPELAPQPRGEQLRLAGGFLRSCRRRDTTVNALKAEPLEHRAAAIAIGPNEVR
jgi:hypothetical protein